MPYYLTILAQVDPSPFATSFGVPLGTLVFVIVVLCGIITGIVWRDQANRQAVTQQLMAFVSTHQKDSHASLEALAKAVTDANEKHSTSLADFQREITKTLNRQSRGFDYFMTTGQILERIEDAKRRSPVELTPSEIAAIAQQVTNQYRDLDSTRT